MKVIWLTFQKSRRACFKCKTQMQNINVLCRKYSKTLTQYSDALFWSIQELMELTPKMYFLSGIRARGLLLNRLKERKAGRNYSKFHYYRSNIPGVNTQWTNNKVKLHGREVRPGSQLSCTILNCNSLNVNSLFTWNCGYSNIAGLGAGVITQQ